MIAGCEEELGGTPYTFRLVRIDSSNTSSRAAGMAAYEQSWKAELMKVLRLRWLGIPAQEYDPMVRFLRDVMGLRVEFEEPTTTELSLPSGDRVQVFAPGDPYFDFFRKHAHGPVALFEVDDVRVAHSDLAQAGIAVIGEIERDSSWEWLHVRAPDGNLYEFASRRSTTS
jgi:catechol 2,3-dioxygenase-like lactoylglutathione lyase family enzyme